MVYKSQQIWQAHMSAGSRHSQHCSAVSGAAGTKDQQAAGLLRSALVRYGRTCKTAAGVRRGALCRARSAERAGATDRGPFAACAMAMGTVKEHDVILTYLQHMDEQTECAAIPSLLLQLFAALCTPRQAAVMTLKILMLLPGAPAEGCMKWAQRCWTPYLKL